MTNRTIAHIEEIEQTRTNRPNSTSITHRKKQHTTHESSIRNNNKTTKHKAPNKRNKITINTNNNARQHQHKTNHK